MSGSLSLALSTLWSLRRLALLCLILPWVIWMPPMLASGAGLVPTGWDAWVLLAWPVILLVLLVSFPSQWHEPVSLAIIIGVLAVAVPLLDAWLARYRPLSERQLVFVIIGGGGVVFMVSLLVWAFLSQALNLLALAPPVVRLRAHWRVRAALPARMAFQALRHAPLRASTLRMTGEANADGWFPVWLRQPWEKCMGERLEPSHCAAFIGLRRPDIFVRILSEGALEQRLESIPGDIPLEPGVVSEVTLSVRPFGDGCEVIEAERGVDMPVLMALSFWLYDYGRSSLRGRLDHLGGLPRTSAPHLRGGSVLQWIGDALSGSPPPPQAR